MKTGGTNECWKYDISKNTSELIGRMLNKRVLQKSILTSDQLMYILGGD